MPCPTWPAVLLAAVVAGSPTAGSAQARAATVPLAQLIGAFLVDSGVRTTGLPWTTGDNVSIRWESRGAVTNPAEWMRAKGLTHARVGHVRITLGDSVVLPLTVTGLGPATGLARVGFSFDSLWTSAFLVHREMVETALKNDGMTLQPIKCLRATEGASYGNLVDAARMPGKTASGLWWSWQTVQQESQIWLTLLYRRADMSEVECYTP